MRVEPKVPIPYPHICGLLLNVNMFVFLMVWCSSSISTYLWGFDTFQCMLNLGFKSYIHIFVSCLCNFNSFVFLKVWCSSTISTYVWGFAHVQCILNPGFKSHIHIFVGCYWIWTFVEPNLNPAWTQGSSSIFTYLWGFSFIWTPAVQTIIILI